MASAGSDRYMTFDEAAERLGMRRESVRQLTVRGHVHSVPNPADRRRKLVLRSEVETYARLHAQHPRGATRLPKREGEPREHAVAALQQAGFSPELLGALAIGAGLFLLLMIAFDSEKDDTTQLLIAGALGALGALLVLEWYKQGKITEGERRRLEELARQSRADPAPFMEEMEKYLEA